MKIAEKKKDYKLTVTVKIAGQEVVNEQELDRFSRVYMRCFLKPMLMRKDVIEYTGPVAIPLVERLKKPISKRDFFSVMEYIVVAAQKLQSHNFPLNNLRMNIQNIYISETTKELQFLYVPVSGVNDNGNLVDLFRAVISCARPAAEGDTGYIARFRFFLDSLRILDLNEIEQFIYREDRTVVSVIKKNNVGQSGFMTSKPQHYQEHMEQQEAADDATGILEEEDDSTGILFEEEPAFAAVVQEPEILYVQPECAPQIPYAEEEEATGLLIEPEQSAPVMDEMEEEGTCLLEETPQPRVEPKPVVVFPELIRVATGDVVKVNKPVFRMGKERSYVDYFVSDNNAVSRSHADIITRDGTYFVMDLNSKNRTYINNVPLAVQVETEIHDGDTLRLGNEEFTFHTRSVAAAPAVCPNCGTAVKKLAKFCSACGSKL